MKKIILLIVVFVSCEVVYSQQDTTKAHEYYAARQRQYPNQWAEGIHVSTYTVADSVMFDGNGTQIILTNIGTLFPVLTRTDTINIIKRLSYLLDGRQIMMTIDTIKAQ